MVFLMPKLVVGNSVKAFCPVFRLHHDRDDSLHGQQHITGGFLPSGVHRSTDAYPPRQQPQQSASNGGACRHLHIQVPADEECAVCPASPAHLSVGVEVCRQCIQGGAFL